MKRTCAHKTVVGSAIKFRGWKKAPLIGGICASCGAVVKPTTTRKEREQ